MIARIPFSPYPLRLSRGYHDDPRQGMCMIEAAGYLAGEPWGDHPSCVDPGIAAFGRTLNDSMSDADRQMLVPFVIRLIGTNNPEVRDKRIWLATDRCLRTFAPIVLRILDRKEASLFEALDPIVDYFSAEKAAQSVGYMFRETATLYGRLAELSLLASEGDEYYVESLFDGAATCAVHHATITKLWGGALQLLDDLIHCK